MLTHANTSEYSNKFVYEILSWSLFRYFVVEYFFMCSGRQANMSISIV